MFRLLFTKNLIQNTSCSTFQHGYYLQAQYPKFCTNSAIQHTPTISYLINKCGLSLDSAISASKKIHIETTERPDSVLQLFKSYNFNQPQITDIITKYPNLILYDPVKILKPKLEFFESLGLLKHDIAKIISSYKAILVRSLENQIIPSFSFFKRIIHNDRDTVTAVARYAYIGKQNFHQMLKLNVEVLRNYNVPEPNIAKLIIMEPWAVTHDNDMFKEIVRLIMEMGFDPSTVAFVNAISVRSAMGMPCWEKKLEAYQCYGLSEEDVIAAFKLQPRCMVTSEKKIKKMMDFYLNELGLTASEVSKLPNLMLISLENRIIPRCSVLQVLVLNGLIEKDLNIISVLNMAKNVFENNFVIKYPEIALEVSKAYKGELGYPKFEILRGIKKTM